jgi:two-component system response regulator AtoC
LAINCQDLGNPQRAEELLGHQDGDFLKAFGTRRGIFASGNVGTLFFDHIERMPLRMQEQVLRLLDWISGQKTDKGIRILAAAEADLDKPTKAGAFNKALCDRLKVFAFFIPPLRDRKDDIPPLCQFFFENYRRELGKAIDSVAPEVVEILERYDFPGNVGELEHIIERAVIMTDGATIEPRHLPMRFQKKSHKDGLSGLHRLETLAEMEKRYIVQVFEAAGGNKSKTAEILGISRAALWRKLKQINAECEPT